MRFPTLLVLFCPCLWLLAVPAGAATGEAISGRVIDAETAEAIDFVIVAVVTADGKQLASAYTAADGRFLIPIDHSGPLTLRLHRIGYRPGSVLDLDPGSTRAQDLLVPLVSEPFIVAPVIITANRAFETGMESAVSATSIGRREIESQTLLTPYDPIKRVTGADWNSKGLTQKSFAVRGGRGVTSGAILLMQDFRPAEYPRVGFNLSYTLAPTPADLERIEVVRGPPTAIYGPNAGRGVVHFITRSPLDAPGTSISIGGGERNVFQTWFRHASRVGDTWGFRLSGQFSRGDDWAHDDPSEFGNPDYRNERWTGEATLQWRPRPRTEFLLSGGVAEASNYEVIFDGPIQAVNLRYPYLQLRARHRDLRVNLFHNRVDSGDSYFLAFQRAPEIPFVDRSRNWGAQVTHDSRFGPDLRLSYGADFKTLNERTEGTLNGANEDNDTSTLIGAFVHGSWAVAPKLEILAALRGDYNDRSNRQFVGPRVGAVYRPSTSHALRAGFNRTGSVGNVGFVDVTFPFFGNLTLGNKAIGKDGWQFARNYDEGLGGLSMRSLWDPSTPLPADATREWDRIAAAYPELAGVPAPDGSQVQSRLAVLQNFAGEFRDIDPSEVIDVEQGTTSPLNEIEVGYKGNLAQRFSVGVDVYWIRIENVGSELRAVTPNVFFDEESLARYFVDNGFPADSAAALAGEIAGTPVGTVEPIQVGESNAIYFKSVKTGESIDYWGADLSLEYALSDVLTAGLTYSLLRDNVITKGPGQILSVPENKAAFHVLYGREERGLMAGAQGRLVETFEVQNGLLRGTTEGYAVFDLNLAYRIPGTVTTTFHLTAENVFNNLHSEYVATPRLGRLLLGRIQLDFQ